MLRATTTALFAICLLAVTALAQPPQAPAIPNLKGTWQAGEFQLHHKVHGYIKEQDKQTILVVTEQNGRVFHGSVTWGGKAPGKDTFSGVIDKDNVSFYLAGHMEGMRIGKMEGPDAFTFYYVVPGGQNPRAGYVDYKRAK